MSRYATGLVVGKFAPLHLGHELVIRQALATCDRVVLLSYSRPEFPGCGPTRRATWLAARFPETVRIVLDQNETELPDNLAPDDEHRAFCADILHRQRGLRIDAIFSSEGYGPGFAADLARRQGAPVDHVSVDASRSHLPISGTALRANPHGLRRFLAPEVYATFVERIVLLGGESTGKSTLASALADALGTTHVPEYGRELWNIRRGNLTEPDLLEIAAEQIRREDLAVLSAATNRYVVCDTSPLTTLLYSMEMFGRAHAGVSTLSKRAYHHTFLCSSDFPFVQDGTRRDPAFRDRQQAWYRKHLAELKYHTLSGSVRERLTRALAILNQASRSSENISRERQPTA